MNGLTVVRHEPFFFIPPEWEDDFTSVVKYEYFAYLEHQINYPAPGIPVIPNGALLTEEDGIIVLVDNITADIEHNVRYPEAINFQSDEEWEVFHSICQENLNFSIYDINLVLDRNHMTYMLGNKIKNMPIKGVW